MSIKILFFSLMTLTTVFLQAIIIKDTQGAQKTAADKVRKNSTELYTIASAYARRGEIDRAITAFKEVIKVNPYYSLGHYGLGRAYLYKRENMEKALKHLKLSVLYDRRLSMGHFYLGMAYMFYKRYHDAINSFLTAYSLNGKLIEAQYNIGAIYEYLEVGHKSSLHFDNYLYEKDKEERDILF